MLTFSIVVNHKPAFLSPLIVTAGIYFKNSPIPIDCKDFQASEPKWRASSITENPAKANDVDI